jgi:hypothetical protein
VPDVIETPANVGVISQPVQVVVAPEPERVAVRLLETRAVETERREIVSVEERNAGAVVIAVGMQGPPGVDGGGAGSGGIETYVAGDTINGHRVIVTDADGEAIHADVTDLTHANMAMKISLAAADAGDEVEVQLTGRITEPSWSWTPGGTIYVGAGGVLTQTVPASPGSAFSKPVAVAETATRILIIQEPPTILT